AKGFNIERKHANHAFTAVSTPLIDFPNALAQAHRRDGILKRACTLTLNAPSQISDAAVLPLDFTVVNSGAGHRVPSGFSQEREVWLSVRVTDKNGAVVYASGELVDKPHPESGETASDGRLNDEDLGAENTVLDDQLEVVRSELGEDFNLRPFYPLGLPTFQNAFMRLRTGRSYERVHFFTLANHMDNARSLPMLQPVPVRYEIPLHKWAIANPGYCGPLDIEAKLNYRTLPPKQLRVLVRREPALLNESHIDRNPVVVMAEVKQRIEIKSLRADPPALAAVDTAAGSFRFSRAGLSWWSVTVPEAFPEAKAHCERLGCSLPTVAQYDSLGLADYKARPGDNHDELWKERWALPQAPSDALLTYLFGAAGQRVSENPQAQSSRHAYFCVCPPGSAAP
ncbi:hypothetical protein K2X33_04725, partial [bacterium]|nr:hypothetical protein [bacterium]